MRIVMVAESFLPQINGVANTVRHVADRLLVRGHQLLIIAAGAGPDTYNGVRVIRARSFGIPGYKEFPVGLPDPAIERSITEFKPDLVHLASPFFLGAYGLRTARRLGLPTVAIFQTDIAGFARQYPWFAAADRGVWRWVRRTHSRAVSNDLRKSGSCRRRPARPSGPGEGLDRSRDVAQDRIEVGRELSDLVADPIKKKILDDNPRALYAL